MAVRINKKVSFLSLLFSERCDKVTRGWFDGGIMVQLKPNKIGFHKGFTYRGGKIIKLG